MQRKSSKHLCSLRQRPVIDAAGQQGRSEPVSGVLSCGACLCAAVPFSSVVQASEDALDLLAKMMQFDPKRRITLQDALAHR